MTTPMIPVHIEPHPYADIFPHMGATALQELAADIHLHGLLNAIVLFHETDEDGEDLVRILDGRNRYRACHETRHPDKHLRFVWFHEIAGTEADPLEWVMGQNLRRRHLTSNQRKDAAARYHEMRQTHTTAVRQAAAAQTNAQRWGSGEGTEEDAQQARLPPGPDAGKLSRDLAAEKFQVSASGVQSTVKIRRDGAPGLAEAHRDNRVTTSAASQIADLPAEAQTDIVAAIDAAPDDKTARRVAVDKLREHQAATAAPGPAAPTPAPAPPALATPANGPGSTPARTSLWHLPNRGAIPVDRNVLDVLLAVARGQHDHPHRAEATAALEQLLQQATWTAA